jgi:aminoglycoside 6'-N-acetyltransferase I
LRASLWPDAPSSELERDCREFLSGIRKTALPRAVFVIDMGDGKLGGFQEVTLRGAVEGCQTATVAYLEGLLVERSLRRQGWARQLVLAAEVWARDQGCTEIASDILAGNHTSHRVHLKLGYGHVRPLIHFRKPLGPVSPEPVHTTLLAEPIDPAAAVSLVQDPYAPAVRMAGAVLPHERHEGGMDLQAEEFIEHLESAAMLRQIATDFRQSHGLTKLAVILRSGRVAVGETWCVVAASAPDAATAREAAEMLLQQLAGGAVVTRMPLYRAVPPRPKPDPETAMKRSR